MVTHCPFNKYIGEFSVFLNNSNSLWDKNSTDVIGAVAAHSKTQTFLVPADDGNNPAAQVRSGMLQAHAGMGR
jgi:hypothetical protein